MHSCRAYAKHRGVTAMAVSLAISQGRLVRCVVRDANGQPKISDFALADQEWDQNTQHGKVSDTNREKQAALAAVVAAESGEPAPAAKLITISDSGDDPSAIEGIGSSSAKAKYFEAALKELKYKEAAKELAPRAETTREWAATLAQVRTKLEGIPSRLKQAIPTLTVAEIAIVENLIRESLEDLVISE